MTLAFSLLLLFLQAPQARIQGVVVRSDTSVPIANAQVTLRGVLGPVAFTAPRPPGLFPPVVTDGQGRFTLPNLASGSYRLIAAAEGYTREEFKSQQGDSVAGGAIFGLTGGQDLTVVIRLKPTGTVSGRVTGPSRENLQGIAVELLPVAYDYEGFRTLEVAVTAKTNDRGEYRLPGVLPGRYWVRANPQQGGAKFAAAYHPGVSDIGAAMPIQVKPGDDVVAIDLRLSAAQAFKVRGRILDGTTGQNPPPDGVRLTIVSQQESAARGSEATAGTYNPDGTFEFSDLAPGQYVISGHANAAAASPRSGFLSVDIRNADVANLVMTLVPLTTLSGRIVVEGRPLSMLPGGAVDISLRPLAAAAGLAEINQTEPDANGAFTISNVPPGEYRLMIDGPEDVYVRQASLQSESVLGQPLRIGTASPGELRIVFSTRVGRLDGTVADAQQRIARNALVVLVPDANRERHDLYKTTRSDSEGRFSIPGIAPGGYKVFAWEALEGNAYFDPNVLRAYEARGRALRVEESSQQMMQVSTIPEDY
jgi:hypothetical protein